MGKDLRFRTLQLSNWKNFRHVDAMMPHRAFLVGPNASGKSNLLDAFRFLRDLASSGGGLQEAVAKRGGVRSIRCLAARQNPNVEIHVVVQESDNASPWEYDLALQQDNQRRPLVARERVVAAGKD